MTLKPPASEDRRFTKSCYLKEFGKQAVKKLTFKAPKNEQQFSNGDCREFLNYVERGLLNRMRVEVVGA